MMAKAMAWLLFVYHCCNVLTCLFFVQESVLQLQVEAGGSAVKFLPGFHGPLPFQLETGYIGVDEEDLEEDVQLFYYFVKSEFDHEVDPLVLWMSGGPGCSSLTALVYEIGPLAFEEVLYNGDVPTLVLNPNSWTETASIIFVDAPVGTGFSYSRSSKVVKSTGLQTCTQIYQFLMRFLVDHPEFISNPLYIGGDSFAGLFVPVVTQFISHGNEKGLEPWINLKGYVTGNPVTTPSDEDYQVPFTHGMGIISDELYESLKLNCKGVYHDIQPSNSKCLRDLDTYQKDFDGIQIAHVLEPLCGFSSTKPEEMFSERRSLLEKLQLLRSFRCRVDGYKLSYHWANDKRVHEALHIHKGSIKNWVRCNLTLPFTNSIEDTIPYHANLSSKGYRSLIYSGDHDWIVPFLATQAWIRSLNYSIVEEWRQWIVEGQVAGFVLNLNTKFRALTSNLLAWCHCLGPSHQIYLHGVTVPFDRRKVKSRDEIQVFDGRNATYDYEKVEAQHRYTRTYANQMTFATIKGGGHTAPEYKPEECKAMFKRWMSHKPL